MGWTLLAVLAVTAGVAGWLLWWAQRPAHGPVVPVAVDWPAESTAGATRLLERGLVDDARAFRALLAVSSPFVRPEPGPHLLTTGLTPAELLRRLGRLPSRGRARVVIPEGLNSFQIAERLHERGVAAKEAFLAASRDREALLALGVPGMTAEGYLFPATYDLGANTAPDRVVETLVKEAKRRLAALGTEHATRLKALQEIFDWTEEEVVILASVVEKEARVPEEMPLIASVFFNRLTSPTFRPARMLQSDPTAGYGCLVAPELASCAGFDGRHVTPAMLRDPENAFNTYRRAGLPPGPIANPGERAIAAVLAPAATDYLFFVVREGGRHTFSRTYEEHEAAVRLLRERTAGGG
jgi:UPF0755 protein